jgi:hypothetical protein
VNDFFKTTELLDVYGDDEEPSHEYSSNLATAADEDFLGFRNATFTWNPNASGTGANTPSSQFKLTVPGTLKFAVGRINLIVGPT